MAENSSIEWTDHTFNPWRGCTKIAAGCANCYAEKLSKRNPSALGVWGDDGRRVIASEAYWRKPLRWAGEARKAPECPGCGYTREDCFVYRDHYLCSYPNPPSPRRPRVFCASLADVFEDRPELVEPRARLCRLIVQTPELDWLFLTKRPQNAQRLMIDASGWLGPDAWPRNVWLGTSVANQEDADRNLPELLKIPAAVRFVSYEPAVGPVDWFRAGAMQHDVDGDPRCDPLASVGIDGLVDWIIVGGESGPGARPFDVAWARSTIDQCRTAGVACFVKQLGAFPFNLYEPSITHPKGGDWSEWPEDLRVREFPR